MEPGALKLRCPCTCILSGPSSSGKTTLVRQIIQNLDQCFDRPPAQIVYCFSIDQPVFDEIRKECKIPIDFVFEIPENFKPRPRTLMIMDDLQNSAKTIADYFTKISHHSDSDVLYLVQNIFLQNDSHRTCNLNTHALCLFKNPRNSQQIGHLARQIRPNNPKFLLSAYRQATEKPHGYLFLNLQQATPDHLRVRDSIFYTKANFFVDKNDFEKADLGAVSGGASHATVSGAAHYK